MSEVKESTTRFSFFRFDKYAFSFIFTYLIFRIIAFCRGFKLDGYRVVDTFMQFPDISILNFDNFLNIFLNFRSSAVGMPLIYIVLNSIFDKYWMIAYYLAVTLCTIILSVLTIRNLSQQPLGKKLTTAILIAVVGLNPAVVNYEAQFYPTWIISLLLWSVLMVLWDQKDLNSARLVYLSLSVSALVLLRPSFTAILSLPLQFYILMKLRSKFPEKILVFTILVLSLLPAYGLQTYRVAKHQDLTLSVTGASAVILGMQTHGHLEGLAYQREGYVPFTLPPTLESKPEDELSNPLVDSILKVNGLPNYNSDFFLEESKRDQAKLIPLIIQNPKTFVQFLKSSLLFFNSDPTCVRILLAENVSASNFLGDVFYSLVNLQMFQFYDGNLSACFGKSGIQVLHIITLFSVIIFSIVLLVRSLINKRFESEAQFAFWYFTVFVLTSVIFSVLNGSPEAAKYRFESQLYFFFAALTLTLRLGREISNWQLNFDSFLFHGN